MGGAVSAVSASRRLRYKVLNENILSKLDIENVTKTEITKTVRKEKRIVDSTALREAVINAIIHNDYSNEIPPVFEIFLDKFVITSSGGLPQELSQEENLIVRVGSDTAGYWNVNE